MEITAKMVAELRKRSGLPMMKCKKALVEANGDMERAIENLRKAGEKQISKLKGREMNDGLVFTAAGDRGSAAVAVLCETDFVARAEGFVAFGEALAKQLLANAPGERGNGDDLTNFKMPDGRTVGEQLDELVGSKIRENMKVGDWAMFQPDNGVVATYMHHNKKIAGLVELSGSDLSGHDGVGELGNDLGMQIAFQAGLKVLRRDQLDDAFIAKEREIFVAQAENMPEDKREKIAEGKLNKALKEYVLLDQPFIKNDKVSVEKHVADVGKNTGAEVALTRFARIAVGA